MDDFELDVTDLRPTGAAPGVFRSPPRRRALVLALTVVALLAAVADAAFGAAGMRLFPPAAPTPPPPIGTGAFIEWGGVPWGTLLVNGRRVPTVEYALEPPTTRGQMLPAFQLAAGRYTLEYRAAPFPTLRCHLSVPASRSDTCPLVPPNPAAGVYATGAQRVLDLRATPQGLAASQRAALLAAVRAALNAGPGLSQPVMLAPGDHYLAADGVPAIAAQPLRADLVYDINQDPAQGGGMDASGTILPCLSLCLLSATSTPPSGASADDWVLHAHVVWRWQYTTAGGQVAGSYAPSPAQRGLDLLLPVGVRWHNGWQARPLRTLDGSFLCQLASRAASTAWPGYASYPQVFMYTASSPLAPAEGCLLTVPPPDLHDSALSSILYRCGVLLAANDEAARLSAPLTPASAHERAVAAQIAQQGNALPLSG